MQIDTLAVRLRPRTPLESADLGVRLCQQSARMVWSCYGVVVLPVVCLTFAASEFASWLPALLFWWLTPWLDRTILFVLSRAAFGQRTTLAQLWTHGRQVWWSQLLVTLTLRRLSPWRSLTQPVYQLEGVPLRHIRPRLALIRRTKTGAAVLTGVAFVTAEAALTVALASLIFWLAPPAQAPELLDVLSGDVPDAIVTWLEITWVLAALFIEPFYVAAGFGMYLNRRAELEAWDIEQEFKRAFAA